MKKLLLASTVLAGVALLASPASAAVKLDLGGYFLGYGVWADNDDAAGAGTREFDLRRDSEVHATGETTLDNGLTVGFHGEFDLGGPVLTDEAYAYGSGGWGRVNLGSEDGAAYLLQVAAPSADSNVDGLRVYIEAISDVDQLNVGSRTGGAVGAGETVEGSFTALGAAFDTTLDYDHADFRQTDRLSYLTPKFSGFQAGISYAPEEGQNIVDNNIADMASDDDVTTVFDFNTLGGGDVVGAAGVSEYEDLWEASARWDGEFSGFGINLGAGYSTADLEDVGNIIPGGIDAADIGNVTLSDGFDTWNGGANLTWNSFSLGGAYKMSETSFDGVVNEDAVADVLAVQSGDIERETWVVGLGWDNGPYHLGGSWLNQETEVDSLSNGDGVAEVADFEIVGLNNEVEKFTVGGGYTFGPGMTFRGSVAWGEFETQADDGVGAFTNQSADFQQIAVGTDIQF